ncbi:STAS domain-containing protein [Micromonospora phytophila]|uniref:STAS domain-containing protein n=1 Tax=Micromonospora phytophila TaxID=709888 RepID=UPI00202EB48D|nr:STAS domain-containing protein [Micromonospora phytophila]MCM0677834.1 STAS domain-containing protein [Micromonospora phytophila]
MANFETRTSNEDGRTVVRLAGECDLAARDELTSVLMAAVAGANIVVVDMGGLTFLDSTGIHGLVTAHHAARRAGGRLYLVNATGMVANVLDITGVGELLRAPADDGAPSRQ